MCLREDRIRQVLLAATGTVYYRSRLKAFSLEESASAEETLAQVPRLEFRDVLDKPLLFHNPHAPKRGLRHVYYPAGRTPRTAVLMPGFQQPAGVRVSECGWNWILPRCRPTAVASPAARLRELALEIEAGECSVPPLEHAVIAFTGIRNGFLSEEDRDLFWRAYRVPVFEQLLGLGGELLAWECEAHDGLHVEQENVLVEPCRPGPDPEVLLTSLECLEFPTLRLASGFSAAFERRKCACGLNTPRLAGLVSKTETVRVLVAKAG